MKHTNQLPIHVLITLIALTLITTACVDSPFNPITPPGGNSNEPPATGSDFGLVAVTISGIGTQQMSATARPYNSGPTIGFDLSSPVNQNKALKLDGSGDYIEADAVAAALGTGSFTIEAWVKPETAAGSAQAVFSFNTASSGNLNIVFYEPDTDRFTYFDDGTSYINSANTFPPGQWVHIALTLNTSGNDILYVNGQPELTFAAGETPDPTGHFSIGQEYDATGESNFFNGIVDEVRVWETARTQAQIQANMDREIDPSTTGLVAYYRMNETSGTTAIDAAGSNDGALHGNPGWGAPGTPQVEIPASDGTIQLKSVSNGSFTMGRRENGGMRYVWATFKVRNAQIDGMPYNTPRQNLTFLAVDTDDTFGKTAVSGLRLFNSTQLSGTKAKGFAISTIPTGFVAPTGADGSFTVLQADVLQVLSEGQAQTFLSGLPASTTVTDVFPFGFVTRSPKTTPGSRTLPASPGPNQYDGIITFTFKMPLQAQANQDPFEISMLFLPVDDSETRITQSPEEQNAEGRAAVAARAAEIGAAYVTIFPESTYEGTSRLFCGPVRIAGPSNSPVAELFPTVECPPEFTTTQTIYNVDENTTAVTTLAATDPQGKSITYSISGGDDASFFNIGGGSGVLSFSAVPDFETPGDADANNTYKVQAEAGNGTSSTIIALEITVKDVDDIPVFTTIQTVYDVNENTTAVTTLAATDPQGKAITYSISGGDDAGLFNIGGGSGVLSFSAAPDFETPGDADANNTYKVQAEVSNGNEKGHIALQIKVHNMNEAPVFTTTKTHYTFNKADRDDPAINLNAVDDDGDNLTYSLSGGLDKDKFTINSSSGLLEYKNNFNIGDYEVQVKVSDGSLTDTITLNVTVTSDGGGGDGGGSDGGGLF